VLRSPEGLWVTGHFDVALERLVLDPDPDRSANVGSQFIGARGFNNSRYVSAQSDLLTARAVAVYSEEQRKPVYAQLQRLWNRDLPIVPLAWDDAIYVVNRDLRGFKPEPVNSDFWNVQTWKI
jgi:peptide/nickel transport system substrate-binding protein